MFAPNTITERLLQLKKSQAAMVLDALFAADLSAFQTLEISSILHYFKLSEIPMGESVVRKGLFQLARLGLMATRKIMTRSKGRPQWEYRLGSIESMAQILGVKLHRDENRDSIPIQGFKTARAYRAAKHYAYLKRLGRSKPSRQHLGERLGVGRRTTANYEIGVNIHVIPREEKQELFHSDIRFAPKKKISGRFYLLTDDNRRLPYTGFFLRRELEKGHRVYKAWQTTNEYIVY